jgi:glycosyltransferase involved in cell wall biosynthesis
VTRVLLVSKGMGTGGAERLLVECARRLDRSRFDCEVAYAHPGHCGLVPELESSGIRVTCLESPGPGTGARRLRELVRERGVGLVHLHSPHTAAGARLALPRRMPLVYTEHNVWPSYRRETRWANAATFPRNDHVFAVSRSVRESMRYPGPLRRLTVPPAEILYHGFRAPSRPLDRAAARTELGLPADAPVVGTVANLRPEKALGDLLEAAVAVRREHPDAVFAVVGEGPMEGELRARAGALGLGDAVRFTGPRPDAASLMAAFNVFALSSHQEGMPLAVLEAMCAGLPAAVTAAGGLREAVEHEVTGLVSPVGAPSELATSIGRLLADPALAARLGEGGRARARCFDLASAVRRMEDVYEELLA